MLHIAYVARDQAQIVLNRRRCQQRIDDRRRLAGQPLRQAADGTPPAHDGIGQFQLCHLSDDGFQRGMLDDRGRGVEGCNETQRRDIRFVATLLPISERTDIDPKHRRELSL